MGQRFEAGAELRGGLADALGHRAHLAVALGQEDHDAVGLAQPVGAQDDAPVAEEAHVGGAAAARRSPGSRRWAGSSGQ